MPKAKVALFRSPRYVTVDPDATLGAVVGVNLRNRDGSLYVPPTTAPAQPASGVSLDDVQALASAPITVDGSPAEGAFTYGWDGTTTDVPEGDNLYYTEARVYAASKAQLRAGSGMRITPDDGAQTLTFDASQNLDGGGAAAVYAATQHLDGGGANG